jgi:hypothetical protein
VVAEYAALLRQGAEARRGTSALEIAETHGYTLKLELPDGRWDLIETQLPAPLPPVAAQDATAHVTLEVHCYSQKGVSRTAQPDPNKSLSDVVSNSQWPRLGFQ